MPSIPIQSITDLAAVNVTGNETVPLVQQVGAAYYTYKTPIKNFFYNGAVPPSALSASPLTWTYSGQVGIGTTTPNAVAKLDVQGGRSFFAANNEQYAVGSKFSAAGGAVYFGATNSSATPNAVISNAGGTALMTLSTNGFVGIGNTTPATRLDVSGVVRSRGLSSSGTIILSENNTSLRFTDTSGTFPKLSMQADNNFVFYGTNSTGVDRAIWNVSQRSSTSRFNFNIPVNITGNNTQYDAGLVITPNTLGTTKRAAIILGSWYVGQDSSGDGRLDYFIWDDRTRMEITSSASSDPDNVRFRNVNNGAQYWYYNRSNVFGVSSDERTKNTIQKLDTVEALQYINRISPSTFISDGDTELQAGFIAQDLLENATTSDQKTIIHNHKTYNKNNPDCPILGVADRPIVAYLVAAMQEQQKIIIDLQTRLKILENKGS